MPSLNVKKNDVVTILSGRDKGKKGKVLKAFAGEGKVLVDGMNIVKRHTRPRPPKVPQGGILEKSQPMPASKVMLLCPHCNVATRVGHKIRENGTRVRQCKHCGEEIE